MMGQLDRYAGWSAYLSVAATLLGFICLIFFFTLGQPFGTLNDAASVLQVLFMIPIAVALQRLGRATSPKTSLAAAVLGIGAMTIIAVLQSVLVLNPTLYFQVTGAVLTAGGGLGAWLVLANFPGHPLTPLPRRLTGLGILAGVGYLVLVTGFLLGGQENILFVIGSLGVVLIYPIWAIWLGRILTARAGSDTPGHHR